MNWRTVPPVSVAAAAFMLGGLLVFLWPQHGLSIVQLVLVTVAVTSGLYALVVAVPEWTGALSWSPFQGVPREALVQKESREIERIRAALRGRRQRVDGGPPLPPDALRLLVPMIRTAFERGGLDTADAVGRAAAAEAVSDTTWAIFTSEPENWLPWYSSRRPSERRVADIVHHVLDDLDRVIMGTHSPSPPTGAGGPGTS